MATFGVAARLSWSLSAPLAAKPWARLAQPSAAAGRALLGGGAHALEVGGAGGGAAFGQTSGDVGDHGVGHAISSCQVRPSRSISAVAAAGPAVPAG